MARDRLSARTAGRETAARAPIPITYHLHCFHPGVAV
jgi:hypothetical protein